MSINNSREYLEWVAEAWGFTVTDHLVPGSNVQIPPGTYVPNWDTHEYDAVTFKGTTGRDTLFGGGGEFFAFFLGTAGDDLYGAFTETELGFVDYSGAKRGVRIDLTYTGSQTFTDADGAARTVDILGKARDGFGGTDYFADSSVYPGSGVYGFFGSSHRDVMIADPEEFWGHEFYGGAGNDLLIDGGIQQGGDGNDRLIGGWDNYGEAGNDVLIGGTWQYGGDGNDRLVVRFTEDGSYSDGGAGNDFLLGTDFINWLIGGAGNDRIFAKGGNDEYVTGDAGNDYVDGGAGDDFIDGGVGCDVLVSGSGNDTINPDVEFFQEDPDQPTDGVRDVIRVTRDDLGAYRDRVLFGAFEEGIDEIRFGDAVRGGVDYRVYTEPSTVAGRVNTVLRIDHDGDGFGVDDTPDTDDYFLTVAGAELSLHDGYLLT